MAMTLAEKMEWLHHRVGYFEIMPYSIIGIHQWRWYDSDGDMECFGATFEGLIDSVYAHIRGLDDETTNNPK